MPADNPQVRIVREIGALLDWVDNGEEGLITRQGIAVARLVPSEAPSDWATAKLAAARIRARRAGAPLGELRIKDLVDEDRP